MRKIFILMTIFSIYNVGFCQNSLSLSPDKAVTMALETYPTLMQANAAIESAQVNTQITKSIYTPTIQGNLSYMWTEPTSHLGMDGKTIHITSNHDANIGVTLTQLIWDFGKNKPSLDKSLIQEELAQLKKEQTIQNLALQTLRTYYMTAYARHSINVKEKQLEDYGRMLGQEEIKRNTGSATSFDYLNTSAEYNSVKTELIALNTNKEKQYVTLSLYIGEKVNDITHLDYSLMEQLYFPPLDSLIEYSLENRTEMKIMYNQLSSAQLEEKVQGRNLNPTLSAKAQTGVKSGYAPAINDLKFNYSIGAALAVPILEGGKHNKEKKLAKIQTTQAQYSIELAKKQITSDVANNYLSLVSAIAKKEQLAVQVAVSEKAYKQAIVNYAAGAITNLELLTSSTNAVNSQLMYLQEQIQCQVSYYALMVSIGENIAPTYQ